MMAGAMRLDQTQIPDPNNPRPLDGYGSASSRHELVVASCSYDAEAKTEVVRFFLAGQPGQVPVRWFAALVASHELKPTGRIVVATEEP